MKKTTRKIITAVVLILVVAIGVLTVYYRLTNRSVETQNSQLIPNSEIEKLKNKDLEQGYPETPTEVVKLYWRYNKYIYNNDVSEEDLKLLVKKLMTLYDEELLAMKENSLEQMADKMQEERKEYKKHKRAISSYIVDGSEDVEYATLDGKQCATLTATVLESVGQKRANTYEKFLCRKDKKNKWRIVGWKQIQGEDEGEK